MSRTLKVEDRIAHYQVRSALGAGGMGEVYRARDLSLERDVALKILPPELMRSEERVRRFTLEAKSASSLNHPHIVTIYEIGEDRVRSAAKVGAATAASTREPESAPIHYISMELVQGRTLSVAIHEERTDLKTIIGWLAQAAEGVAKAHAAGIIHRDLKPGNIMVSNDGYAKVLDFGLAKLTERAGGVADLSDAPTMTGVDQTSDGAVVGTAGYMAPEQVRGQPVDARADVFAFGCILYEASTRKHPFAASSKVEIMHRILHDSPAPIEQANPDVPVELRRLIRRCLAKDPNQRAQSMKDLAIELGEIRDEYETLSASATSSSGATMSLPRRSPPYKAWSIAAAILLVALAAAVALFPKGPVPPNPQMRTRTIEVPMKMVRYPGLSADGQWIAVPTKDDHDRWGLYYMNAQGGELRTLVMDTVSNNALDYADISSNGMRIAYAAALTGIGSEVRAISVLGGSARTVARPGMSPRWRPDGQRIGYIVPSWASKSRALEFWTVRPDGSDKTQAFVDSTSVISNRVGFAWSPDGTRVAWLRSFEASTYNEIMVRDLASGRERQITQDHKVIDEVTWDSRDEILFSSNRGGATNIWLMRASGGKPIQVTRGAGPDLGIRISADSRRLLYLVKEPLVRIGWWDVATGEQGRLTREDQPYTFPRPSPDGRKIAVTVQDPDAVRSGAVVVMNRDGTEPRTVVPAEASATTYDWSPDGRHMAWASAPATNDSIALNILDLSTGESSPPLRVATRGFVRAIWWQTEDTLLINDRCGSLHCSISSGKTFDPSPEGIYCAPTRVPGWKVFVHPLSSSTPGIFLQSAGGGPEQMIMKPSWMCGDAVRSNFLYCWPDSLGFSRLDLPSGRLSLVAHEPSEVHHGMLFFPNRDGRVVYWLEQQEVSKLVLVENFRK